MNKLDKNIGVRIFDEMNGVIIIDFPQILDVMKNGDLLYWSILYLEAIAKEGETESFPGHSIREFEKLIMESENGFNIQWNEIKKLATNFHQVIDIILIGSERKEFLHRYLNDKDMFRSCNTIIKMVDSSFWEIYSKNADFLFRLKSKFKQVENLESL